MFPVVSAEDVVSVRVGVAALAQASGAVPDGTVVLRVRAHAIATAYGCTTTRSLTLICICYDVAHA